MSDSSTLGNLMLDSRYLASVGPGQPVRTQVVGRVDPKGHPAGSGFSKLIALLSSLGERINPHPVIRG